MVEQFFIVRIRFNKPAIVKPRKRPPLLLYGVKRIKQGSKGSRRSVRKHVYWKSKRECVLLSKK
jgi:hypothetical protein